MGERRGAGGGGGGLNWGRLRTKNKGRPQFFNTFLLLFNNGPLII